VRIHFEVVLVLVLLLAIGGVVWIGRSLEQKERVVLAVAFVLGLVYLGMTLTERGLLGNRTSDDSSRSVPDPVSVP